MKSIFRYGTFWFVFGVLVLVSVFLIQTNVLAREDGYTVVSESQKGCLGADADYEWGEDGQCYRHEEATVMWLGFDHSWKKNPHRLNRLGSLYKKIQYEENADTPGGLLSAKRRSVFEVGAYDDEGVVRIKGEAVKSGVLGFYDGFVDEDCLVVSGEVGSADEVECPVFVDLQEAGLSGYDQVSVILRGFTLESESYDKGYNARGFTIRVIPVSRAGDEYFFRAKFMLHAEHAPDRPSFDDACGQDNHCTHYQYSARIFYTLVGVNGVEGNLVEPSDEGTNSYAQNITMYPFKTVPWTESAVRSAHIYGNTGFDQALVAIQGLSWHLNKWPHTEKDGRYIRELKFYVAGRQYDAKTGEMAFLTNMYFSNTGAWPYGFEAHFTMWNTLVQFNDPQGVASGVQWDKCVLEGGEAACTEDLLFEL
ncbi:MAG: hypothetical protein ACD_62C00178G0006 [uncultured bacterium]|nr:MAG: hypothetical protein ACD_62C00178G0006 [uncultured bacterium]HLD45581.1 hypothetical protein [bacterium]